MAKTQKDRTREELLDELLKDYKDPEDLLGRNGIFAELKKRLLERAMEAEMEEHLGYSKNGKSPEDSSNCRNGHSRKKVIFLYGRDRYPGPRDRDGAYEPRIVSKHQRRFDTDSTTRSWPCMPER